MRWLVLVIIAIIGFGACAYSGSNPELAARFNPAPPTKTSTQTKPPAPIATPTITPSPTTDWPRQTVDAAKAEQAVLAVECTRVSIANTEAAGKMERQITADAAALMLDAKRTVIAADAQRTAEADYQYKRAQVATATAQAIREIISVHLTETPSEATRAALDNQASLDRDYYEFQKTAGPIRQSVDAIMPCGILLAIFGPALWVLRRYVAVKERQALADFEPQPAQQETLPEFVPANASGSTLERVYPVDGPQVAPEKIQAMARKWVATGKITYNAMCYQEKILTQDEIEEVQKWMILTGRMFSAGPQKYKPTKSGIAWLCEKAGQAPLPTAEPTQK